MKVLNIKSIFFITPLFLFIFSCADSLPRGVTMKNTNTNLINSSSSNSDTSRESQSSNVALPNPLIESNNSSSNNNTNNNGSNNNVAADSIIHFASTNSEAQTDCSNANAKYTSYLLNVDFDVKVCVEFVLDLPVGSARYGESRTCKSDSDYVTLTNNNEWTYDQNERSWRIKNGGSVFTRNSYFVPGNYRALAKNKTGDVTYSSFAYVGRPGYDNCNSNAQPVVVATQPKVCEWSAFVFGETPKPTASCTQSNIGAKRIIRYNNYDYEYTCGCN